MEDEPQAEVGLLLVAEDIAGELSAEKVAGGLRRRLGLTPAAWLPVTCDFDIDEPAVTEALNRLSARGSQPDLILLQEAWQPPIEETLAFFQNLVRLQVDPAKLWIVLIGRPASDGRAMPAGNAECRVWYEALRRLGNPAVRAVRLDKNGNNA
jgi:hypothetical protein